MDKRTVIGIIILAAILILMPYYQKIISGDKEAASTSSDTTGSADIDRTTVDREVSPESSSAYTPELSDVVEDTAVSDLAFEGYDSLSAPDTIPEKLVYVRTKLMEFTLTSKGGDIVSAKSKEFLDLNGEPMEYCPQEISGDNFPVTAYRGRQKITTEAIDFITDGDTILLTESDTLGSVVFTAMISGGGLIQRGYNFKYDDYVFTHSTTFSNDETESGDYIEESVLWWRKGLEPSDPDIKGNVSANYRIGYMMGGDYSDEKFGSDEKPQLSFDGNTDFVATHNKYFVVVLAPLEGVAQGVRSDGVWYSAENFGDEKRQVPALGVGLARRMDESPVIRNDMVYIGPRDYDRLEKYNRDFEKTVNLGWSWLQWLTKAFMWVFEMLYSVIGNYGFVIIVFSIIIKLLLLPLSRKQMQSMKKMKDLEPKLSEVREQYKSDVKKLNEETMKLYQKEGINPMGGCLPLLPQMPVFFALFALLRNSFALRGAPFIFWITDLSQRDPYYVLPILMAITMFVQQKITVRDPKQKMMVYFMPLFFLFIFRNMPSGLVLYWFTFNIFSLVQTLWMEYSRKKPEALPSDV